MNCPICGEKVRIVETRKDCESVVRKRQCVSCGHKFYTQEYETPKAKYHFDVLNSERSREQYQTHKVRGYYACNKKSIT